MNKILLFVIFLHTLSARAVAYQPVNNHSDAGSPANGVTVAGGRGAGRGDDQLNAPSRVTADAAGNVYVADFQNSRIQQWVPGAVTGTMVAGNRVGPGSTAAFLQNPSGVSVDAAGNVYVSDTYNHRVQKWAPGATSGSTVAGGNGPGAAANQLNLPEGIFVDPAGNIYIADVINHRIQQWPPGATAGITVAGGNGAGTGANQFSYPYAVYVDAAGNSFVADRFNNRIQKWAPGAAAGITVAGGNGPGAADNQLYNPTGLVLNASGNIYIADYVNNRIQQWAPGAATGTTIAGGNGPGAAANQLEGPFDVCLDAAGSLYVADEANNRIQKFTRDALPVTLAGFTATPGNRVIMLDWATATEQNNQGFEVQRAQYNALDFTAIGWVDGKGSSAARQSYRFADADVVAKVPYYYRLKQQDINGRYTYSATQKAVLESAGSASFRVAPNPASHMLYLYFSAADQGNLLISVLDAKGALVLRKLIHPGNTLKAELDISPLANGHYYLQVQQNNHLLYSKAFLKTVD